jgi:hypothetical protein
MKIVKKSSFSSNSVKNDWIVDADIDVMGKTIIQLKPFNPLHNQKSAHSNLSFKFMKLQINFVMV